MKFACLQENLAKGLSTVAPAVSSRTTLPITQNVLMSAEKGRLKLCANNLEMCIATWVGAKVETEGAVTMPHSLLQDFVNSLPNELVQVDVPDKGRSVTIASNRFHGNISLLPAEDFPPMPKVEGLRATVKGSDLRLAIIRTEFAASRDESRPVLTGVNFAFDDKGVTLASADGFRLAVHTTPAVVKEKASLIIPARSIAQLMKLLNDDEDVEIHSASSMVLFRMKNAELYSTIILGTFPNYMQLIPKNHTVKAVVDAQQLHQAVKVAALFSRSGADQVKVKLVEPGKITVAGWSEEVGDNLSEVDAQVNGSGKVAFNSRYILDVLQVLKGKVSLEIGQPSAPALFKSVDDANYLHVIMPMFIGGEW